MHCVGRLRGSESFKRFVRKLTARRNLTDKPEHASEDFAQTWQAIRFVNFLELRQIPKFLGLLEEQPFYSFFHGRPILFLKCFAQDRISRIMPTVTQTRVRLVLFGNH